MILTQNIRGDIRGSTNLQDDVIQMNTRWGHTVCLSKVSVCSIIHCDPLTKNRCPVSKRTAVVPDTKIDNQSDQRQSQNDPPKHSLPLDLVSEFVEEDQEGELDAPQNADEGKLTHHRHPHKLYQMILKVWRRDGLS